MLVRTQMGVSDFQISGQSFIKENCRTSNDIDMKFGKHDKQKMVTLKKLDDDVMSANCDVTVVFPIYSQFGAIR